MAETAQTESWMANVITSVSTKKWLSNGDGMPYIARYGASVGEKNEPVSSLTEDSLTEKKK